MNKKGEWSSIISKKELWGVIGALIFALIFFTVIWPQIVRLMNPPIEEQIVTELRGEITGLTSTLQEIKSSILLLNQNIVTLQTTKASDESVKQLNSQIIILNSNLENNTKNIQILKSRVDDVENTMVAIEPSYVQNIDTRDLRTYINIFNFRLVLNFFFALTFSLISLEFFKVAWDFASFSFSGHKWDIKKWNIKTYLKYRSSKKNYHINTHQHPEKSTTETK